MKDVCTPATAARLKAAGFPQPAPATGQVWYVHRDAVILSAHPTTLSWLRMFYLSAGESTGKVFDIRKEVFSGHTFAPGVADLLRVLGGRACISEDSDKRFAVANNLRIKIDWEQISGTAPDWQWFDENPAEALAAAWLSENGNPADLDEF